MHQTLDLHARDITGVAEQQRRAAQWRLVKRVALVVFLLTVTLIWFTV